MRKLVLPIAVLALAGCADETDERSAATVGGNAGTAAAAGSADQRVATLEQRVAQLEQRLNRIERTAVVVGPEANAANQAAPQQPDQNMVAAPETNPAQQ